MFRTTPDVVLQAYTSTVNFVISVADQIGDSRDSGFNRSALRLLLASPPGVATPSDKQGSTASAGNVSSAAVSSSGDNTRQPASSSASDQDAFDYDRFFLQIGRAHV